MKTSMTVSDLFKKIRGLIKAEHGSYTYFDVEIEIATNGEIKFYTAKSEKREMLGYIFSSVDLTQYVEESITMFRSVPFKYIRSLNSLVGFLGFDNYMFSDYAPRDIGQEVKPAVIEKNDQDLAEALYKGNVNEGKVQAYEKILLTKKITIE